MYEPTDMQMTSIVVGGKALYYTNDGIWWNGEEEREFLQAEIDGYYEAELERKTKTAELEEGSAVIEVLGRTTTVKSEDGWWPTVVSMTPAAHAVGHLVGLPLDKRARAPHYVPYSAELTGICVYRHNGTVYCLGGEGGGSYYQAPDSWIESTLQSAYIADFLRDFYLKGIDYGEGVYLLGAKYYYWSPSAPSLVRLGKGAVQEELAAAVGEDIGFAGEFCSTGDDVERHHVWDSRLFVYEDEKSFEVESPHDIGAIAEQSKVYLYQMFGHSDFGLPTLGTHVYAAGPLYAVTTDGEHVHFVWAMEKPVTQEEPDPMGAYEAIYGKSLDAIEHLLDCLLDNSDPIHQLRITEALATLSDLSIKWEEKV